MTANHPPFQSNTPSDPASGLDANPLQLQTPGLALPALQPRPRIGIASFTLTTLDRGGRLSDRSTINRMNWSAGQHLAMGIVGGDTIVIRADEAGDEAITQQGFLRLPALVRRRCDLNNRNQVLIAAYPTQHLIVIWTTQALDDMVSQRLDQLPILDHR